MRLDKKSVVATARQLGEQGLSAYDAGRYDEAAQKLSSAYRAVKVPTFARNAARALAKQGKLVAASELYLEATRLTPNKLWRGDLQQQAQREAAEERAALLPRIAHLKIIIAGSSREETRVTVDEATVPEALLGMEQLTDPGTRRVIAKRGTQTVEETVNLKEGEHSELVLRFESASPGAPGGQQAPSADVAPRASGYPGNTQRTLGWVGIGIGAVGVATGAATGLLAVSKRSSLHGDGCSGDVCPNPSYQGRVDTYNSLLTVSSIGFIVGGVGLAAGVTLLLTSPKRESPASMSLQLGPGSVAVSGGF